MTGRQHLYNIAYNLFNNFNNFFFILCVLVAFVIWWSSCSPPETPEQIRERNDIEFERIQDEIKDTSLQV